MYARTFTGLMSIVVIDAVALGSVLPSRAAATRPPVVAEVRQTLDGEDFGDNSVGAVGDNCRTTATL